MCILATDLAAATAAQQMAAPARQQLALDALAGVPISHLAAHHHVSRKFVYQQLDRAEQGLTQAFQPPQPPEDLLFWLPVTKPWLHQLVLGLLLICHSSSRGVLELLRDLFDYPLSLGTVHNLLHQAIAQAEPINRAVELSAVRVAALDEIFQSGQPVLVGADADSGYCFLLSPETHRDGDTWGVRLLELHDKGLDPDATIADFGTGLRAGAKQAFADTPCRADIFHPLRDFQALSTSLDNRAYDALSCCEDLAHKRRSYERRHGWKNRSLAMKAVSANQEAARAIALADDVRTLLDWWRRDVLAVAGPDYATRLHLHGWIVEQLRQREELRDAIKSVRTTLENHSEELLAFALELDEDLAKLAQRFEVSVAVVREALAVQQMDQARPKRHRREKALWQQLGSQYARLRGEVEKLAEAVVRASSVIENLNSRLRNHFFLRKQVGPGYLKLLQFYLNHRRFSRSDRLERVGKSPREVLSGQKHAHWLELLGYHRFRQAA